MNFFSLSIPIGQAFGIPIRVHITFLLYIGYELFFSGQHLVATALFFLALFLSVLLHEFGHSLAARWCDGSADEIILWPLGGLAVCQPVFNPKANLITGAAGPAVSLLLLILFSTLYQILPFLGGGHLNFFIAYMARANQILFLFNLIPAFPMDGGRILRDSLWLWLGVEKATHAAVILSRSLSLTTMAAVLLAPAFVSHFTSPNQLAFVACFIFYASFGEQDSVALQGPERSFSIRNRFKTGLRRGAFRKSIRDRRQEDEANSFHRCVICGHTEKSHPGLAFRIAANGEEYCAKHLPIRKNQHS
ncbi:MAG: site-2 protease family protein [Verrucomicrobiae bacterium]|nr:site-2 protease family protein [Verrucomicrobiae bacterium]